MPDLEFLPYYIVSMNTAFLGLIHNMVDFFSDLNPKSKVKFTYSAMHGVGYECILAAFKVFGFEPPVPVIQQVSYRQLK